MAGEIVKTGIKGLDAMLYGGIPKDSQLIITGGPGAGKTLLAFEYIYKNALEGNTGIFFALEENPEDVLRNAKSAFPDFGRLDELIAKKRIIIAGGEITNYVDMKQDSYELGGIVAKIENEITKSGATRAVVDSSSALELLIKGDTAYRRSMWSLAANFRRLGVTSILTSESDNPDRSKFIFKPEHFIFDGIIVMYQSRDDTRRLREIEVIKIRGHNHSFVTAPYEITGNGFEVLSPEAMSD